MPCKHDIFWKCLIKFKFPFRKVLVCGRTNSAWWFSAHFLLSNCTCLKLTSCFHSICSMFLVSPKDWYIDQDHCLIYCTAKWGSRVKGCIFREEWMVQVALNWPVRYSIPHTSYSVRSWGIMRTKLTCSFCSLIASVWGGLRLFCFQSQPRNSWI